MGRAKLFRDSVKAALEEASGIPIYHNFALPMAAPPFGVFSTRLITKQENVLQYDLMVDISDYGNQEDRIDEIADKIEREMDYYCHLDAHQTWESYLSSRQTIEEADKNIQRRRLQFSIRYVERID